jgi:glycosyltransferase involved in cell wall biosynthesis
VLTCDIIVPARNAGPFIGPALDSLLVQSLLPQSIIVVNDGSTDETGAILASYEGRIQVVESAGRTASAARNLGVRQSQSDLVAFLDADDVCDFRRVAEQVRALRTDQDAGMVFCDGRYVDAAGLPAGGTFDCPEFRADAFLGLLFERNRVLTSSVVTVRRSAFDAAGGFDERLSHAEDYDLWLRLAAAGPVAHLAEPLVSYRLHAHNLSHGREAHGRAEATILAKHPVAQIRSALLTVYDEAARAELALCRVLFRMRRYEDGEQLLRGLSPADSDEALWYFMLGAFAVKRHDPATAGAAFKQSLEADPTFAPSANNLGVLAAAEGAVDRSRVCLLSAAALRPGYADPGRNLAALEAGRIEAMQFTFGPLRPVLRPE